MKRRIWKRIGIVVGVVFVAVGAWGAAGVLLVESEAIPSFAFLDGRTVSMRVERKQKGGTRDRVTRVVYSFEADFDTVCSQAEVELPTQGFKKATRSSEARWFGSRSANEYITIGIHNRQKIEVAEGLRWPREYYVFQPGWVSVDIIHERPSAWRNIARGPLNLLYRWGLLK